MTKLDNLIAEMGEAGFEFKDCGVHNFYADPPEPHRVLWVCSKFKFPDGTVVEMMNPIPERYFASGADRDPDDQMAMEVGLLFGICEDEQEERLAREAG